MTAKPINNTSASVDLSAFNGSKYCHAGLEADSNVQAGGCTTGGTDKLLTREGGADDPQSTQGPGGPGRSLA
jgi:hypothetical protein